MTNNFDEVDRTGEYDGVLWESIKTPTPATWNVTYKDCNQNDYVNHPAHYTQGPVCSACGETIECVTVARSMMFNRGNAIKYIWRAGHKDNEIQDLEKAVWYLNDEIQQLKAQRDDKLTVDMRQRTADNKGSNREHGPKTQGDRK